MDRGTLDFVTRVPDSTVQNPNLEAAIADLENFFNTTIYFYADDEVVSTEEKEERRMGGSPFRLPAFEILNTPVSQVQTVDELVSIFLSYFSLWGYDTEGFKLSPVDSVQKESETDEYSYLLLRQTNSKKLVTVTGHGTATKTFQKGNVPDDYVPTASVDSDDWKGVSFVKLPQSLGLDNRSYLKPYKWFTSFVDDGKTVEVFGRSQREVKTRVAIYRALKKRN